MDEKEEIKNEENVLIIGNGFDIAHGLKTTYKDFLMFMETYKDFLEKCNPIDSLDKEEFLKKDFQKTIKDKDDFEKYDYAKSIFIEYSNKVFNCFTDRSKLIKIDDCCIEYNPMIVRFICGNLWYDYFIYKLKENKMKGDNWIDFENEIFEVVKFIEHKRETTITSRDPIHAIRELVEKDIPKLIPKNIISQNDFIAELKSDLEILTYCLEFYLCLIECYIDSKEIEIVADIHPQYLISFNYTNIFKRIYINNDFKKGKYSNLSTDFIHGRLDSHNLVLGTEETLEGDKINQDISCIDFKKYFQRIHNRTGLKYKDWFIKDGSKKNIYIFGHSLDKTDGDVLKYIILHEKTQKVYIYYHDDKQYRQEIANLVKVIDKNELISRIGNGQIEFIDQNENG